MHERAELLADHLVTADASLEREFETRLMECSTLAFRVAFSVLRHREDAEDVAQEAFARAYRRFRQLRSRDRFRAWLVRMTWRLALDRQRADRRRLSREQAVLSLMPSESSGAAERTVHLWEAIDTLSEKLRMVVVLAAIEGHDMREVASIMGLPEGTVKSRLFLARRQLKERLR
jgi:RNA polymerase sigma-70 factor, ECF subfamily